MLENRAARIAVFTAAIALLWMYYLTIDALVRRPAESFHKSPKSMAEDLAQESGATWRLVRTTSHDRIVLEGWLFTPARPNGHAVLVMHQMGGSRLSLLRSVGWLLRAGYICLAPDGRAHGMSGGLLRTYGIEERHDVAAWTRKILDETGVASVAGLGVSLGGTVLLQGAAAGAPLRAVVADSTGANLSTPYDHVSDKLGIPLRYAGVMAPVVEPLFWNARLRYGLDLHRASPVDAIRTLRIPVLLIHGTEDRFIPVGHARRLRQANPEHATLWEVEGAGHTQAQSLLRREYQRRVLEFLRVQ